jgi:hypothetical protein
MSGSGWTPADKKAMMEKLYEFYEEYYYENQRARMNDTTARAFAQDQARNRLQTLEYNDVFTCAELLQVLSESAQTTDRLMKRKQLQSVFQLMLVYNEKDPGSRTFEDLYALWQKVMTHRDTTTAKTPPRPTHQRTPPVQTKKRNAQLSDDELMDVFEDCKVEEDNKVYEKYVRSRLYKGLDRVTVIRLQDQRLW